MKKTYFMQDVVAVTEIKQPTLQQWLRDGFIEAATKATGTGTRNLFDFSNLCEIILFQRLIENGVSRELASSQIKSMPPLSLLEDGVSNSYFIVTYLNLTTGVVGSSHHMIGDVDNDPKLLQETLNKEAEKWVKEGFDMITLYSLKKIVEEVKNKIEQLNT